MEKQGYEKTALSSDTKEVRGEWNIFKMIETNNKEKKVKSDSIFNKNIIQDER